MEAGRLIGWISKVLPVLLTGMHLLLAPAATPARDFPSASPGLSVASSPRQSLPLPVHDEATCAFCQAAAFAPYANGAAGALAIVAGDEQRIHLSQDSRLTHSWSARQPRSRAPPVIRSV
jgi:hypothetical protein